MMKYKDFLVKNWNFILGCSCVFVLLFTAIFANFLAPYDPISISLEDSLAPPSNTHLLGCDTSGTDVLSIIIYGARLSLQVGLIVTVLCVLIGLIIGSISGYMGGKVDTFIMRILDIIFAFPGIILAIAVATVLGASKFNVIFALVMTGWAGYTRLVRGEIKALKEKEYIIAANALGMSPLRIVTRHMWPNIVSPILVTATFGIAGTILSEASLSFLGVGVPASTPSWGALLNQGKDFLVEGPHIATFPGFAIMFTILGLNFLGEGLRERLDPKG